MKALGVTLIAVALLLCGWMAWAKTGDLNCAGIGVCGWLRDKMPAGNDVATLGGLGWGMFGASLVIGLLGAFLLVRGGKRSSSG